MAEESILPPSTLQKHSCCSVHLKPLLEKISTLEHKLLIQTERRQNEYNELLHILLTVKRPKKDENSPGKSNISTTKPISKLIVANQHLHKKNKEINGAVNTEVKPPSKGKSVKKNNKPLRRSSENFKKIQITMPAQPLKDRVVRDEQLAQTLQKHGDEIDKLKQLTNYLMQQLLMLFEKIRQVEAESLQMASPKTIPTQQTINSVVFDASHKQMMKNEPMALENQLLEQKVKKLQSLMMDNSHALHEQHAKISEHEHMLAQLIALTRGLSNRIVQIPLYMNSSFDSSPKKA